jgi:polysaccharide export outer membrane protein
MAKGALCKACAAALAVLLAPLVGCQRVRTNYPYQSEPDPRASEYVIGVSDDLEVSVWKNRDLDAKIAVRPDGNITIPLIGDVQAAGMTPSQLRADLAKRLSHFLRDEEAVVTVSVLGVNSYFVTVAGNVTTPGRISSRSYLTVVDAIALAGGPNRFALASEVVVLRRAPNGAHKRIPIDYGELSQGKRLEQNIVLLRGDRIFIP